MEWEKMIGKKVFCQTKDKGFYNGVVLEIDKNLLVILDKFGDRVFIDKDNVSKLKEEEHFNKEFSKPKISKVNQN